MLAISTSVSSVLTLAILIAGILVALAIGIGLAYLPMRLLMSQIARNVRQYIERQRERRRIARTTPDRRGGSAL